MSGFFKSIEEAEYEMQCHTLKNPKKRKKIAEDYFKINKNIKFFIDKKYFFSYLSVLNNRIYMNDLISFESDVNSKSLSLFTTVDSFRLEKRMSNRKIDFLELTDEISIYLEGMYEGQINIRPIIRKNLKEIYKEYYKEILESSLLAVEILEVLNTAEIAKISTLNFINKERIYEIKNLYNELENIGTTLLLTKDIDITRNLEKIKSMLNKKNKVSNDIF